MVGTTYGRFQQYIQLRILEGATPHQDKPPETETEEGWGPK